MLIVNGKEYLKQSSIDSAGTATYLDAGATQTVVEVTNSERKLVKGCLIDCNALTQNGTFGFQVKVDGTNYREVATKSFTVASDDSIYFEVNAGVTQDFKFTYTEAVDEGDDRSLPYMLYYEVTE